MASSNEILKFEGRSALTGSAESRVLTSLQATIGHVTAVNAQYLHLVEVSSPLDEKALAKLETLLTYGPRQETKPAESSHRHTIVVVPRFGTISPWSSQATELASLCGLHQVARIERGILYTIGSLSPLTEKELQSLAGLLHDRMTEVALPGSSSLAPLFSHNKPKMVEKVDILTGGLDALVTANCEWGLALSPDELDYLYQCFCTLQRNPSNVELMMFGQINSEHCRHKIFNADFVIDGERQPMSLFQMIRNTAKCSPHGLLSAYNDNAAVVEGHMTHRLYVDPASKAYRQVSEPAHLLMKVETHNHPTAISPFPGAATGSGGEIRDEAAVGRGSKTKAGLVGFSTSQLRIPGHVRPWEVDVGTPERQASAFKIMIDGPLGSALFNNEFGRPGLAGYFRTLTVAAGNEIYGYHKPIMLAGGMGLVRAENIKKGPMTVGAHLIVLGGPAMLIGLGGGAASSMESGANMADLDFASVQRGNPEMQRRCQEVIDCCAAMGDDSPIELIHDVGAGGLCNAFPELVNDCGMGGVFDLRKIPSAEPGLSPLEIWCNEAQERFVLSVRPEKLDIFTQLCARERCPFACVGISTEQHSITLNDPHYDNNPVDLPSPLLFGKPPKMVRNVASRKMCLGPCLDEHEIDLEEALRRVLKFPAVGSKSFLVTICDRSVTGQVTREQMVGRWQVPVADVAVTSTGYDENYLGEAMAIGERSPLAVVNAAASARMAVGEALTNIAAAPIAALSDVRLSANWMAACGMEGQDAALYEAVKAVGLEMCPCLGTAIPVGKDSLSMRAKWDTEKGTQEVVSPVSLIVSAFSVVSDVRRTLTPELQLGPDIGDTRLYLVDIANGKTRTAGSALAQTYGSLAGLDDQVPDVEPTRLAGFFKAIQSLANEDILLAYHDRSDGGLIVTVLEMCFSSHCGVTLTVPSTHSPLAFLFAEELGAIVQVKACDERTLLAVCQEHGVTATCVGEPCLNSQLVSVKRDNGSVLLQQSRTSLHREWAETSYLMQRERGDPACAQQEYDMLLDEDDPGQFFKLTYNPIIPRNMPDNRPMVAILRDQGVNGHVELAYAFHSVGFTAIDVHMSDVLQGQVNFDKFAGLACAGGFSHGDVLGAGEGWAKSLLLHPTACTALATFFSRPNTFTIGICNGCQMLGAVRRIIPGTEHWPRFVQNKSGQFEARTCMVEVVQSPSIFLKDMAGSMLPIAVAHGEGRVEFDSQDDVNAAEDKGLVSLRYVDHHGTQTERYPLNPNGSQHGITAVTSLDGRVTALMPHPERMIRSVNHSWYPKRGSAALADDGPWLKMFRNAFDWSINNQ